MDTLNYLTAIEVLAKEIETLRYQNEQLLKDKLEYGQRCTELQKEQMRLERKIHEIMVCKEG